MNVFQVFRVLTGLCVLVLAANAAPTQTPAPPSLGDAAKRIREEGLKSPQVMDTLGYLTEVIGPRLTASPSHKRANEWTRDKLASWGLTNAHLEAVGPFGKGWSLKSFTAQLVEPQAIPLLAYPKAWSPGLENPIVADVVYLNATNSADLQRFKGKLKGAVVLISQLREVRTRFEPLASRMTETNLLRLANAGVESPRNFGGRTNVALMPEAGNSPTADRPRGDASADATPPTATYSPSPRPGTTPSGMPPFRGSFSGRVLAFAAEEGAALLVSASPIGDGGAVFVTSASTPLPEAQGTNASRSFQDAPRAWSTNVAGVLPQITMAVEDYNRLVRMIQQGEKLKMAVDLRVQFHTDDLMAYNTIAEIPGTDLKDELVMIGGHLDSWHAGTGATDDAIGVAAAMEAVRILRALKLEPRRTIRVALWAGEEQGLLGSKAYVARHFGYYTNLADSNSQSLRSPKDNESERSVARRPGPGTTRKLVRMPEYDKLSVYLNLDNGGGQIRGIHLQGNEELRPYFRRWFEPFKDLSAETISLSNTRGTDHLSFDAIGLPGLQFIQDPLDYNSRTHHSNQDVLERILSEDAKQAAIILASFAYNAAMIEDKLPRKKTE